MPADGAGMAAQPGRPAGRPLRVAYLFTTFPLLTETPAQRELRAMRDLPVALDIYSLWGGAHEVDGLPVQRFCKWRLAALAWLLPWWLARRPRAFATLVGRIATARPGSALNAGETVLGIAFALCHAGRLARSGGRPELIHAAWATMPATAAQFLRDLTGIPFSMGAHAYDVFRDGGDCLLASKLASAALVVTSSEATLRALMARGAEADRTVLIRRGLDVRPEARAPRRPRDPLRILAVGRLIEKKGYFDQLAVYAALREAGLAFEARIVGGGPLARALKNWANELGLSRHVTFTGPLPYASVRDHYAWADVLLFTGKVAASGDRDGLPNVIPEAMAAGVPVIARAVGGVPEAVEDGRTGVLITGDGTVPWLAALTRLRDDYAYYGRLCCGAQSWVETHFDARQNARRLLARFEAAAGRAAASGDTIRERVAAVHG